MPPAKRATTAKKSVKRPAAKRSATKKPAAKPSAIKRLVTKKPVKKSGPVDQAAEYFAFLQASLEDLRKSASKETKAAIVEIEKLLREGQAGFRRVEKRVRAELDSLMAAKPAARKPAARKPAVRKPAARKPAARKPAVRKPAVRKPAVRKPAPKKK